MDGILNKLIELPAEFQLSWQEWGVALVASWVLGMAKGGIKGLGILIITMMVFVFGGKASTGIVVLLLIAGDILAVIWYRRHVRVPYLIKLLPAMVVGVLIGVWIGRDMPELIFRRIMAIIILCSVILIFYWEKRPPKTTPDHKAFYGSIGFLAGFTTMIGNLAGPLTNIYFLAIRLPKAQFIGTAAWLFFIINIFKLPFHIFSWETITTDTVALNLRLLPFVILGFFSGVIMVKHIRELQYRYLILFLTAVGALLILVGK